MSDTTTPQEREPKPQDYPNEFDYWEDYADYWKRRAERAERERDELARWRDEAVANCAKRQCSLRDRRLAELEAERDELRAALARAEDAREKDGKARAKAAGMQMEIDDLRALLREAMRRAQNHGYICASDHGNVARLCDCGLNDLRARVAAVLGEKP